MKACTVCRETKNLDAFNVSRKDPGGRRQACRECTRERQREARVRSPERRVWQAMIHRCESPDNRNFVWYGGRGIVVCERWRQDFANFAADMGPRPSSTHTIDRIDNDGNYEPSNCRWATKAEQTRNTSVNVFIEWGGRRLVQEDWAKELGIRPSTMSYRLKRWPLARAMTEPRNDRARKAS